MELELVNRFLMKITKCNDAEYAVTSKTLTRNSYNYITKKSYESTYLLNLRFIPSGMWFSILNLENTHKFKISIQGLKEYIINDDITEESINEWLNSFTINKEPRWYQFRSLFLSLKYRVSRIEAGTGAGKTFIQYLYARFIIEKYIMNGEKVLVVVPRRALVYQTVKDFKSYANDDVVICDHEFSGGFRFHNSNVVVGTFQTLSNYEREYFSQFIAVMVDESHTSSSPSIRQGILQKLNPDVCIYRLGLSATQPDNDTISGLDVEAYLGPVLFRIPAIDLANNGFITKLKFTTLRLIYDKEKSMSLWFTEGYDIANKRLHIEREWMHYNESRNNIIKNLVTSLKKNQLILVESVEYVHILFNFISIIEGKRVHKIYGQIGDKERLRVFELTEHNDDVVLIATYGTMYMGVSIDNIFYIHFPDGGKSKTRIKQSFGRGMRLHKDKEQLIVFDYSDELTKQYKDEKLGLEEWPGPKMNIFKRHSKIRQQICKSEGHEMETFIINV